MDRPGRQVHNHMCRDVGQNDDPEKWVPPNKVAHNTTRQAYHVDDSGAWFSAQKTRLGLLCYHYDNLKSLPNTNGNIVQNDGGRNL